jgi:N-acetylglucosamine kinase-like BadF-type ATPase
VRVGKVPGAAAAIVATVANASNQAGESGVLEFMVVGAAGTGLEENREALHAALADTSVVRRVHVTTDGEIALESAFPSAPGILLSAGTGSIAHARDADGVVWRVGGQGWRFGDEGSAYALGRAGISAALQGIERRGSATALSDTIPAAVSESAESFHRWLQDADVEAVAKLARVVSHAAAEGDSVAQRLVGETLRDLVAHVRALLHRFPKSATVDFAMSGGLISAGSPLRAPLLDALAALGDQVRPVEVTVDPAVGALALAARLAG